MRASPGCWARWRSRPGASSSPFSTAASVRPVGVPPVNTWATAARTARSRVGSTRGRDPTVSSSETRRMSSSLTGVPAATSRASPSRSIQTRLNSSLASIRVSRADLPPTVVRAKVRCGCAERMASSTAARVGTFPHCAVTATPPTSRPDAGGMTVPTAPVVTVTGVGAPTGVVTAAGVVAVSTEPLPDGFRQVRPGCDPHCLVAHGSPQGALEISAHGVLPVIGRELWRSTLARSRASPREAWLLTEPTLQPRAAATSASGRSSK